MTVRAPPVFVGIAVFAAGVVASVVTGLVGLHLIGDFHNRGHRVTVPDTVTLSLDPDQVIAVMQEQVGPHVSVNRPLRDPPADLTVTVADARTGEPIEVRPNSWWMAQNAFGLSRRRSGLFEFTSPDHGEVTVTVAGSFEREQAFYVGPTFPLFDDLHGSTLIAAGLTSAALVLAGLTLVLIRVARAPDGLDPDQAR